MSWVYPLPPPGPVPPASKAFWLTRPELPAFTDDLDRESLHQALQRSLEYARRLSRTRRSLGGV